MKHLLYFTFFFSFLVTLPETSFGQIEIGSDTLVKPSRPNRYRPVYVGGKLVLVPQSGPTIPVSGTAVGSAIKSVNGITSGDIVLTSSSITEGSRLYYTDGRVQSFSDSRYLLQSGSYVNPSFIQSLSFSKLTNLGNTLSFYGITDATKTVNGIAPNVSGNIVVTTDNISEATNQYYTNARARNAIGSNSTPLAYDASTGRFTLTLTKSDVGLPNAANLAPADYPISTATSNALLLKADNATIIPYTTVSNYASAVSLSNTGVRLIVVTSDEQYNETNSLYFKFNSTLYKLLRNAE